MGCRNMLITRLLIVCLLVVFTFLNMADAGMAAAAPAKSDLTIAPGSLTYTPAVLIEGTSATFRARVQNIGNISVSGVKVRFFIDTVQLGKDITLAVDKGETSDVSVTYKIPSTLIGKRVLKVVVDPDKTFTELDESNNEAEKPVDISKPYADLAVQREDIKGSNTDPKPGSVMTISAVVRNTGTIDVKKFTGQIFVGEHKAFEKKDLSLKKNSNITLSCNYTITSATPGSLAVTVKVDPEGLVTEKDETNNTAAGTIELKPLAADFSVNGTSWKISPQGEIAAGTKFTVGGRVTNLGTEKSEKTEVTFSLVKYEATGAQKKNRLGTGTAYGYGAEKKYLYERVASTPLNKRILVPLGSQVISPLDPGGYGTVYKQLTLPADYDFNGAEIEIRVNGDNGARDADKSNNTVVVSLPARPESEDAAITDEDISIATDGKAIKAGGRVTAKVNVSNLGTGLIRDLKVNYYLNAKPRMEGATLVAGRTIQGAIKPGESYALSQAITIPQTTAKNQMLLIQLDPDKQLKEQNRSNNIAWHTIPLAAQSCDLGIELFEPDNASPWVGQTVGWKARVKNYGSLTANNVSVGFYTDVRSERPARTAVIKSIAGGASADVGFTWDIPTDLPFAVNYPVKVTVDWNNQVEESNEENNSKTYGLTLKAPDLSVESTDVKLNFGSILKGNDFIIRATVRNSDVLTAGGVKASLLYYVQGESGSKLAKLGDYDLGTMAKGENKTISFNGRLPQNIAAGTNIGLVMVVDPSDTVLESDELNNRAEIFSTVVEPVKRLTQPYLLVCAVDEAGNCINGATVTLKNAKTGTVEAKETGKELFSRQYLQGRAAFESLPTVADYTVTVSAPGYRTVNDTLSYDKTDPDTRFKVYSLDKRAVVSGRVTSGGAGLSGAAVSADDGLVRTVTGTDGNYSLLLEPGTHTLKFTKAGYGRLKTDITLKPLDSLTLNEFLGRTDSGYVDGYITDGKGIGIEGVTITNNGNAAGATDKNGQFHLTLHVGATNLKFSKSGFAGIQLPEFTLYAGTEESVAFSMIPAPVSGHVEKGTDLISWHRYRAATDGNGYSPDEWWGMGRANMGMDYTGSGTDVKMTKLKISLTGLAWYADHMGIKPDGKASSVDVPLVAPGGGDPKEQTRLDVCRVAVVSNGTEIWSDSGLWSTADDPDNWNTRSFSTGSLPVAWNSDFKVKIWLQVGKKSSASSRGEGAGEMKDYSMERKVITWYPQRPVEATVVSTFMQGDGCLRAVSDGSAIIAAAFMDALKAKETANYIIEEAVPWDFPGSVRKE